MTTINIAELVNVQIPVPGRAPDTPSPLINVLESRPPTRLSVQVRAPGSAPQRWGLDEHNPANVPAGLSFSTTMPGGFEQASCTLARQADRDYPDLQEFSTVTVYGAGGEVAWQGRLETTPRTSGDQLSITPGAVGWQAALDDDSSARMIYIDSDLTRWGPESVQMQYNEALGGADIDNPIVTPDSTTGIPALATQMTGPWSRTHAAKGWYDAKGLPIAALYYAWRSTIGGSDANWSWQALLSTDDLQTTTDTTADLQAAGPGTGTLSASATNRRFAVVQLAYLAAAGSSGVNYSVYWTYLGVVGQHGLTIQGSLGATGGIGVLASDVVQHAIATWAPELKISRAGQSTIQPSTFVIPQLAFLDPTTVSNIVAQATQYGLVDWWVDEGDPDPTRGDTPSPTFNLTTRFDPATGGPTHGRDWRARVGPSGLQETGPQVDHMYNAVIVAYNDVTGRAGTVTVTDTDPTNPVTAAGLDRTYSYPNIGVSTPAGATAVGQRFLFENSQRNTAGQAQIVGHVQDAAGLWWPAWTIRAGDRITFTDAHDPTPRRVTRTQYTDASRACQIDLDSPPQDLSQLLARYSIALTGLGV